MILFFSAHSCKANRYLDDNYTEWIFLYESLLIRSRSSEYNKMSHIKSPTIDYSHSPKKTVVLKINLNKHLSRFIPKTTVFFLERREYNRWRWRLIAARP